MTRTITVGLAFDFEPDSEHADLFEGMTEKQIIKYATEMAIEDICRLADGSTSDLRRQVFVEVKTSED